MSVHSLKFSITINPDDVIGYLDRLSQSLDEHILTLNHAFARDITGEYGNPFSGVIAPRMSITFNPYLYLTGQDEGYWKARTFQAISQIEILYTGRDINEFFGGDVPEGIWWEFATYETMEAPPTKRELKRDYAYFQETGKDKLANPKMAKHKGAITKGIASVNQTQLKTVEKYMEKLLREEYLEIKTPYDMGWKD